MLDFGVGAVLENKKGIEGIDAFREEFVDVVADCVGRRQAHVVTGCVPEALALELPFVMLAVGVR